MKLLIAIALLAFSNSVLAEEWIVECEDGGSIKVVSAVLTGRLNSLLTAGGKILSVSEPVVTVFGSSNITICITVHLE